MDAMGVAWLPGLVFLGLLVWLVRKAIKAARTERDLEEHRLAAALAEDVVALQAGAPANAASGSTPLVPQSKQAPRPTKAPEGAPCRPEHLALMAQILGERERRGEADRVEVVWARSAGEHLAWCERRAPAEPGSTGPAPEVLCIVQVRDGKIVNRWTHGAG
ncbi:MAG TPA: hypothetical protein VN874_05205 [Myxococcales bacterium]|jgi:hypothetical protein|nr:hypothetical protein [Myxococcales bacterium]